MARRRHGTSWKDVLTSRARSRERFEDLVAQAIDGLPEMFRKRLDNVAIVVEETPGHDRLLGLYQGVPQPSRGMGYSGVLPDKITIYRQPIERRARSDDELAREVRKTVLHEIAHHFGISDERLHELGWG